MRWRFIEAGNNAEASARAQTIARIDAWWKEFAHRIDDLRAHFKQNLDFDIPEWMANHLQAIHPLLMWEFGPAVHCNGHRLVITPESRRHLRPLTSAILERAPRVTGWEFYPYRLPESVALAQLTVNARTGQDIGDFRAFVRRGEHQRVDICYYSPSITNKEDQQALNAAFVATESLLGEELLDKWIGAIEVLPLERSNSIKWLFRRGRNAPKHLLSLDQLRETAEALIGSIVEQLPNRACFEWVDQTEWTLWKLTPADSNDSSEQRDLFVGKSANNNLWAVAHGGGIFQSERFSRCGETFCYVKLDGTDRLDEQQFADKTEIEDTLDAALKPSKLGCIIGGGTGKQYSYVDLALVDLERGIEVVRQVLRSGNVSKRSWIQFFDSDLAAEWVGIYEDSPPPPMPCFDE